MISVEQLRAELPAVRRGGYFNGGYTGPLCQAARTAIDEVTAREFEHGRMGRVARATVAEIDSAARANVARLLGVPTDGIALNHHTTDGVNTVAHGLSWQPGDNAVTTQIEHKGGILPLGVLAARIGLELRAVGGQVGRPTVELEEAILEAIDEHTRLVVLSHVSYVTGAVLPLERIVAKARQHDALVIVDGAQSAGVLPIDVPSLGVDGYTVSGQKWLCGPEGTGALYLDHRALDRVEQTWVGWASAISWSIDGKFEPNPDVSRFEVGTRSIAALAGFSAAVAWHLDEVGMRWAAERTHALAELFMAELGEVAILTPANHVGLVSLRPAIPADEAVERLADAGVDIRSIFGFNCIRASVGYFHTEDEVVALARLMADLEIFQTA